MHRIKRKWNKRGFTLAELLIVVAIIAVLVAVSIPVFTSKLEKAREAVDVANMRAAKAIAVAGYLDETISAGTYFYDIDEGVLKSTRADVVTSKPGYGKGTSGVDGGMEYKNYDSSESYKDSVIKVVITGSTETADGLTNAGIEVLWDPAP